MRSETILLGLINIIVGLVEIFLGLRLFLKFFGAGSGSQFVSWVYDTTAPLIEPFVGMFPSPIIDRGFVFEFSTLFAIFIYALIAWLLKEIIIFVANSSKTREVERVTEIRRY